jgi:hypothetical protein
MDIDMDEIIVAGNINYQLLSQWPSPGALVLQTGYKCRDALPGQLWRVDLTKAEWLSSPTFYAQV